MAPRPTTPSPSGRGSGEGAASSCLEPSPNSLPEGEGLPALAAASYSAARCGMPVGTTVCTMELSSASYPA